MSTKVTLTGTHQLPDGTPASGVIEVIPSVPQIIDATGDVILSGRVKVKLDAAGHFSVALPATDDTSLNPTGFGYTVVAKLHHTHLPAVSFSLPGALGTVDIADLTMVDPATFTPGVTYVTPAELEAAVAGVVVDTSGLASAADVDALAATIPTTAEDVGAVPVAGADDAVALLVNTPGSDTATALSDTYGTVVPLSRLGGGPSKTGAQNRAALQAGIDAGLAIFVPPGITEVAGGLVPRNGMRILGFGKGYSDTDDTCSILRTVSGPLFLAGVGGDGFVNFCSFQNVDLQAAYAALAPMMVGEWASTEFRNVRLRQYHPDYPVIDVTGWIDVVIDGASEIAGDAATTVPLFRAITDVAKIAHIAFRDVRVTGGADYQFHIEATGGGPLDYVQQVEFTNVNHEVSNGGAIRLLSVRAATITRSGLWDRTVESPNAFFYIGAGSGGGHPSGSITIAECVRDASAAPAWGQFDIKAEAGTKNLNMVNNGIHQAFWAGWRVDAGGATGQHIGPLPATMAGFQNMGTDRAIAANVNVTGTGSAVGDGAGGQVYRREGDSVDFYQLFDLGSTSTVGSAFEVVLPIPALNYLSLIHATAEAIDASTGKKYTLPVELVGGGARLSVRVPVAGTAGETTAISATAPFTWAAGDSLNIRARYIGSGGGGA